MQTVWKFQIKIEGAQAVMMPPHAQIIHVGLDPTGEPCVWARVTRSRDVVERTLYLTGTGQDLPEGDNRHIGSFNDGRFVWHAWEPC